MDRGEHIGLNSNGQALQSSLNECFALFVQLRTRPRIRDISRARRRWLWRRCRR